MSHVYTNHELQEKNNQAFFEQVDSMDSSEFPPVNIMVAGITGTGKSTLINAIFGEVLAETGVGRPVTQDISEYSNTGLPVRIWDTVGLELDAETTKKTIQNIKSTISEKSKVENQFDRIHAIWYCVNFRSSRYQGAELDFVRSLHSIGVPFIIVMTQCMGDESEVNAFEHKIREMNSTMSMNDIDVVQVCAKDFQMRGGVQIPAFGLDELVDVTVKKLPSFIKSGFIAAQKVSKVQKREECEEIIIQCIRESKESFMDKIPVANIFSGNKRVMNMLRWIGLMYNAQIPGESIDRIVRNSHLNFENVFPSLISPFNSSYRKKVMALLDSKKSDDGYSVDIGPLKKSDRVALLVAFYGYTFIDSIECLWESLTESQLKDIEMVCDQLLNIINRNLQERRAQ